MKILALETSGSTCTAALQKDNNIYAFSEVAPMRHTEILLPMIHKLLTKSGLSIKNLDAIAFSAGPGSFTGVRIASSVVQAFSFAANLPVIKIGTLTSIAQTKVDEEKWENILVMNDAKMGKICMAQFTKGREQVEQIGEVRLGEVAKIHIDKIHGDWDIVGDGWKLHSEYIMSNFSLKPRFTCTEISISPSSLLKLARFKFVKGEYANTIDALPLYL